MISINEHIKYLLLHHDCVVVPNFGAFIAQYASAYYDESTGLFMPPTRLLSFNPRVNHDDGVLTASIVRREGVSYDVARTLVANEVSMLRSRIDSSGHAVIPRLGTISRSGQSLIFDPDVANALVDARLWGLQPVQTSVVAQEADAHDQEQKVLDVDFRPRRLVRVARIAASVAVLLGLGFALSTPVLVDDSSRQLASVGLPKVTKGIEPVEIVADTAAVDTRTLYCAIPDSAEATARYVKPAIDFNTLSAKRYEDVREFSHYLVVGSCNSRRSAEKFVRRHAADNLHILAIEGRFRVYIKASDDAAEVAAPREEIALRYPGAWIFSRVER